MKKVFAFLLVLMYSTIEINAQNPCSGVFAGSVPHPDPRRCSEYYVCIFFIGSLQQCQANHIFDGRSGNCVPGDQSTCLQNTTPPPGTTTTIGIATTPTTTIGIATTPSTTIGIATSTSVETTTIGIATSTSTTIGIATSTPFITTTMGIATSTAPPPEINLPEICRDVFFAARPHPTSNLIFIGCIRGEGTIMPCLTNEYFDVWLNECVTIPAICVVPENVCEGYQLEIIPHPCHCYRYIVCHIEKNIMDSECSAGTIFNANTKNCEAGDWDTCDLEPEFTRPTPSLGSTPPSTTILVNPCEGVQLGNRPIPGSCTSYYRCINEMPSQLECDPGQIFSREQLRCVDGTLEECQLKF